MHRSWQDLLDSPGLETRPLRLLDNAIYPLASQGFIEVAGTDASKFLQGQLSCDVQEITLQKSGLGSHNNAKGRMQSSFRLCRTAEDSYLMRVHCSILENAKNVLAKYIVFSKASLSIKNDIVGIGLHGPKATAILENNFQTIPQTDYQQHIENGSIIICTSQNHQSYEIYTSRDNAISLWNALSGRLAQCPSNQHQLLENHLGLAFVETDTYDAFIPQMFNYQCTPAISFKKGCYTGQEIVARMHYRGKVKRHMRHYIAAYPQTLKAGMPIFAYEEQSIGDILSAVATGENEWDLLINLTDDAAKQLDQLKTTEAALEQLKEIELPYSLVD